MPPAKALTQAQIIEKLAVEHGLTKVQMKAIFSSFADMAYTEAKKGFTVPGIGKLVLVKRKARKARNPKTGETVKVPARKALKFRISKTAKDAVLAKPAEKKTVPKKTAKKAVAKKTVKKSTAKKTVKKVTKKAPVKKVTKKAAVKKTVKKATVKKTVKKVAKKAIKKTAKKKK